MRKRNWNRSFGIQRLEDRRLLAADVAVELVPVESYEPEICQVAELDSQIESVDQGETLDLDSTEILVDVIEGVAGETVSDPQVETEIEIETEVETDVSEEVESQSQDLGDPVDGTDGFFGSIDAGNPEGQLTFTPSEEGVIDIVVATSFGGAETRLEVTDSAGDLVTSTSTEELTGFQQLSFEAEAGETYQLSVSSEEGAEGYFQVTVEHSDIPEPVDLHADTIGEDSTELQFVDGGSELQGELELANDVDTFRFTAESNGKALLSLAEVDSGNSTELQIQVLNADGGLITRGITNETVGVSFDVQQGTEYFLAVIAAEGQTGVYEIDLAVESIDSAPDTEAQPVLNEIVADEEPVDDVAVDEVVEDQPVDEVVVDAVSDDVVVDDVVQDQPIDEVAIDEVAIDEVAIDDVAIDEVAIDEVVIDDVTEDQPASDQPVDETSVDEQVADELVENQPIEVEVIADQPVDDQPADEIVDVVDVVEDIVDEVVVDQVDDVPAIYDPGDALTEEVGVDSQPIDEVVVDDLANETNELPSDLAIEDDLTAGFDGSDVTDVDDLIDEENEICFSDLFLSKGEAVDSFFAQFDPASIFQVRHGFGLRG